MGHDPRCSMASTILIGGLLFVSGGATCVPQRRAASFPPPPQIFAETPSRTELVAAINRTDGVRELSTNSASIRDLTQSTPRLSATMHLRRDRDFRLRAQLPIVLGAGLDIGSNRDVFWFEVPQGVTRTMYFARHDQYTRDLDRAVIPINPSWLIEAMGLVHLEESQVVAGPVRRNDGLLEIRARMPDGIHQRVCYVHPTEGYVTQQLLTKPDGLGGEYLLAESRTSEHRFIETAGAVLPHRVQIRLTPRGQPEMHLQIDVGNYSVNQLLSTDPQLFTMPQSAGSTVDLSRLSAIVPGDGPTRYVAGQQGLATQILR